MLSQRPSFDSYEDPQDAAANEGITQPDAAASVFGGSSKWRRVVSRTAILGTVVVVAAVVTTNWEQYGSLLATAKAIPLIAAVMLGILGQALNSAIAYQALHGQGAEIGMASVYRMNAIAGLAKYIPGGVWQIGSQAGMGRLAGLKFGQSILAWIEPTAFNLTIGATIAALAAAGVGYPIPTAVLVTTSVLGLMASSDLARYRIYRLLRLVRTHRAAMERSNTVWLVQASLAVIVVALTGLGGLLVTSSFEVQASPGFVGSLAAFVGAWVVGFLAFPLPGGIGIREGVLVLGLAPWMPAHEAALVAIASRLVATTSELLSGLIATALRDDPEPGYSDQ